MRAEEFVGKPHLYLDMDGVQADFFSAWARWHGKKFGDPSMQRYKDIGDKAAREQSITELNKEGPEFVYEFFATLPTLPGGQKLIRWIKSNNIPFTVLSAPLRGNEEASIRGKKYWLDRHNAGTSDSAIFTGEKQVLATKGGRPNVLVDDFKKYIGNWQAAGGIGILYRDANVDSVIQQLAKIYGIDQKVDEAKGTALRTFAAKVRLKQQGYANIIDTTVVARNAEMARRLIRQQYGDHNVMVGQPREIR